MTSESLPPDLRPQHSKRGPANTFVLKVDSGLNLAWAERIGSSGVDEAIGLAIDGSNNLYLAADLGGSGRTTRTGRPFPSPRRRTGTRASPASRYCGSTRTGRRPASCSPEGGASFSPCRRWVSAAADSR